MKMKFMFVAISVILLHICCTSGNNDHNEPGKDTLNTKVTDSIKPLAKHEDSVYHYRDGDWLSMQGIGRIDKSQLTYPYARFQFQNGNLNVTAHYNISRVKGIELKKYKNWWHRHSAHYVRDMEDSLHTYSFYGPESLITLNCLGNPFSQNKIACRSVTRMTSGGNALKLKIQTYAPIVGTGAATLDDILLFREQNLVKTLEKYVEEILRVENDKLYVEYQRTKNLRENVENENREKLVRVPDFPYRSFFYYYFDKL